MWNTGLVAHGKVGNLVQENHSSKRTVYSDRTTDQKPCKGLKSSWESSHAPWGCESLKYKYPVVTKLEEAS